MLHTTKMLHRKRKTKMPHPERIKAVRKSMAMIKVVLGERQRAKHARDVRLAAEHARERALEQLDLAGSDAWQPWIPGTPRELPLAAPHMRNLRLTRRVRCLIRSRLIRLPRGSRQQGHRRADDHAARRP